MYNKFFYSFFLLLILALSKHTITFGQYAELKNPVIDKDGIHFLYYNPDANSVYLKSSFDLWQYKYPFKKVVKNHEHDYSKAKLTLSKPNNTQNYWKLTLPISKSQFQLGKGKYYYKLVINHQFYADPFNPLLELDEWGDSISYFVIEEDLINYDLFQNPTPCYGKKNFYRFIYKSYQKDKPVYLVGEFNDWNPLLSPLKYKGNGIWEIIIQLRPGSYSYNFVVGETWRTDPLNNYYPVGKKNQFYSFFKISD